MDGFLTLAWRLAALYLLSGFFFALALKLLLGQEGNLGDQLKEFFSIVFCWPVFIADIFRSNDTEETRMYYEEKLIDGILHWRGAPDGEWQIIPAEKLGQRVVAAEAFRATVAAALAALRAGYTQRADGKGASIPWRAATDLARQELDATITALDLTADVFDAAIASRPDVLERLADEAVKEKQ